MSEKLYQVHVKTWKDGRKVSFTDDKVVTLPEALKIAAQFRHSMLVIVGLVVKCQCVEVKPTVVIVEPAPERKYSVKVTVSSEHEDTVFIQSTVGGYTLAEAQSVAQVEREDAIFDGNTVEAVCFAII